MQSVAGSADTAAAGESQIQFSLSLSEVEQLRETLPWLLRALASRPDTPPRQRARREHAHALLQGLLHALPPQVTPAGGQLERQ